MGCGCGGGRRNTGARAVTPQPTSPTGNARVVQAQSNQRQALIQQAKDRITQLGSQGASEAERKRRIQVSLRRRNQGKS